MSRPELAFLQRPEQRMLMLPRMLHALELLQMSRHALGEFVENAIAENEALTATTAADAPAAPESAPRTAGDRRTRARRATEPEPTFESAAEATFGERLMLQIGVMDADERTRAIVRAAVDSADELGYRTLDDTDLAAAVEPPATEREVADAVAALRTLEPRGACARGPIEAILWRLSDADPDRPAAERILGDLAPELARNHKPAVARILGLSLEELDHLIARLARLFRHPADGCEGRAAARIHPDIVVRRSENGFDLQIHDALALDVSLDREVEAASRARSTPPELRKHLRERVEAARQFLDAMAQRRWTLERVARAVFLRQPAFLEHGQRFLKPLRMHDLADSLSIHPSTVSRAVAGKYVETDWGIIALRDFFGSTVVAAGGEEQSRDQLGETIRSIFAAEDRTRPLGDEEVVGELRRRGVQVARRTIAKYRVELGIPSSWRRRDYSAQAQ